MNRPTIHPAEVVFFRPSTPSDSNHKFFAHMSKSTQGEFAGWYEAYVDTDELPVYINPLTIERVTMKEARKNPEFSPKKMVTNKNFIPEKDPY